jgi:peptidoglycan/LPS O-acetylase OafA/YrhL
MRAENERTHAPLPIPALTGSRIFLALFVVWFHFGQHLAGTSAAVIGNFVGSGYVSVSMFFLLSGYVLAYNYLGVRSTGRVGFWIARIARIAPAYWAAMCLSLVFYAYGCYIHTSKGASFAVIATALTCTHAWFVKLDLLNFPAWSLSCECLFYILFPFFAGPIMRLDRTRLRWLIAAFALLSMMPPVVYFLWLPDGVPFESLTQARITNYTLNTEVAAVRNLLTRRGAYGIFMYNPFVHLPVFLLGMVLGRYKLAFAEMRTTLFARVAPHASLLLIVGLLAGSGSMPHLILHNGLIAIAFAGFVFYADVLWVPLARLLSTPAVVLLGEASYAVYILQEPLMQVYASIVRRLHLGSSDAQPMTLGVLAGFLVFLCGTSVLTFLMIERPGQKFVRTTLTRMATVVQPKQGYALASGRRS